MINKKFVRWEEKLALARLHSVEIAVLKPRRTAM